MKKNYFLMLCLITSVVDTVASWKLKRPEPIKIIYDGNGDLKDIKTVAKAETIGSWVRETGGSSFENRKSMKEKSVLPNPVAQFVEKDSSENEVSNPLSSKAFDAFDRLMIDNSITKTCSVCAATSRQDICDTCLDRVNPENYRICIFCRDSYKKDEQDLERIGCKSCTYYFMAEVLDMMCPENKQCRYNNIKRKEVFRLIGLFLKQQCKTVKEPLKILGKIDHKSFHRGLALYLGMKKDGLKIKHFWATKLAVKDTDQYQDRVKSSVSSVRDILQEWQRIGCLNLFIKTNEELSKLPEDDFYMLETSVI